jgi:hypothetical protein
MPRKRIGGPTRESHARAGFSGRRRGSLHGPTFGLRRAWVAVSAIAVAAIVVLALGTGATSRAQARVGLGCFSLGNGGQGDFPDDGVAVRDVRFDSFEVVVRWAKSLKCPLPGAIEIWGFQRGQLIGNFRSLTVLTSGGRYEDWVQRFSHLKNPEVEGDGGEETIVPNRPMVVWVVLNYLGEYKVEKSFQTPEDPAKDLGVHLLGSARDFLRVDGNPQASFFGTTHVYFALRDPKDPSSTFEKSLQPGWTCQPTPKREFARRPQRGCTSGRAVDLRASAGGGPLKPNTIYQVRMLIKNSFGGEQWGPIDEIGTFP